MMKVPTLTSNLVDAIDSAVKSLKEGKNATDLKDIYAWLENDGWDLLFSEQGHQGLAINLRKISEFRFDENELSSVYEIPIKKITDVIRIKYSRESIDSLIDDDYFVPSVHTFSLDDVENPPVIGCLIEVHGQAGPVLDWWGLYKNRDDFFRALDDSNIILSDKDEISDERLLSLWKR